MYHLLVSGNGWNASKDSLTTDRVFEYTDEKICDEFKPSGKIDSIKISQHPAIFISEIQHNKAIPAKIGYIYRVEIHGKEVMLNYSIDSNMPMMTNLDLHRLSKELHIADFEFSRTHWAIKDVNLFEVLLRNRFPCRNAPKVFRFDESASIDGKQVSVMMPFHPSYDNVYRTLQKVCSEIGLNCSRVDDIWENPEVIQDVFSLIYRSNIIICDCTGRNPNVFYETGIAHTLGREVILIAQSKQDIPFDLQHLRYIEYLNNNEGLSVLEQKINERITTILE